MSAQATPSLRIARLVISNFRTFHGPTEILLSSGGVADEMPVFHGGNGTGKSNAIAAIELFFRGAACWLRLRESNRGDDLELHWNTGYPGFVVSPREWPPGVREPQLVELHFVDGRSFRLLLAPSGKTVRMRLEGVEADGSGVPLLRDVAPISAQVDALLNTLETPKGQDSTPLFHLDARRREASRTDAVDPASPISDLMAHRLLALATSLEPLDTERWRMFVRLLDRFGTLHGREVSVVHPTGVPELRFEIRGRQILRLSELSSGEQQIVAMCAAVLTSRAAIAVIEEPEISLHPDNQRLIKEIFLEQVRSGLIDQIILESHVHTFDGPEVIRFARTEEGATTVSRQPSVANDEVKARARAGGAREEWVSADGYTQLPQEMRRDLGLHAGGYLYFLRPTPERQWEAWTAEQLDKMFGWKDSTTEE